MTMREYLIGGLVLSVMSFGVSSKRSFGIPSTMQSSTRFANTKPKASRERLTSLFANDTYHLFLRSRRIVAERKPFKRFD